jgi:DNA-binding transcriptional regulator YhcF (GntR family)
MARKPIDRRLPPLEELFPDFKGFPKGAHHLNMVVERMKTAAQRLRKSRNQPFYSMRETARFWSVPLSTMALAYQHLEDGGLLARVRGSRTVLLGKSVHSQHPARSIVSVPFQLSSLISSHFTRRFCHRISEELWKYHFVANLILFQETTETSAAFAQRLVKQSDIVIWVLANRSVKETMLILRDHGVQNVLLQAIEDPFFPANYLMDWTSVYRRAILEWKAAGIRHVVVARPIKPEVQRAIDSFLQLLLDLDCAYTLADPNPFDLRDKVEQKLKKKIRVGCAVLEHELSHQLCNSEPVIMAKLTTRCRVLFGRGCVYAPYFFARDFRADVIGFVGDEVAARVASDLGRRSEKQEPVLLLPRWMPKADLSKTFI